MLTLARDPIKTTALGPGTLASLWFHGCHRSCPGCIARSMNLSPPIRRITPEELAREVEGMDAIDGVVLSGGEPFDQPLNGLSRLLEIIKSTKRLGIVCYTGYRLHELKACIPADSGILDVIDLLIDGPYVEELNDGGVWRGSSNQTLHFLTPAYKRFEEYARSSSDRRLEVKVTDTRVEITGIPPRGYMQNLERQLAQKGFSM